VNMFAVQQGLLVVYSSCPPSPAGMEAKNLESKKIWTWKWQIVMKFYTPNRQKAGVEAINLSLRILLSWVRGFEN
jgi:hypothetical protein